MKRISALRYVLALLGSLSFVCAAQVPSPPVLFGIHTDGGPVADPVVKPAGWVDTLLSGTDYPYTPPCSLTYASVPGGQGGIDPTFNFVVTGGAFYFTDDSGCSETKPYTSDVTLTGRISQTNTIGTNVKTFFGVRGPTVPGSTRASCGIFGGDGTTCDNRLATDGQPAIPLQTTGTPVAIPWCFKLEVDADNLSAIWFSDSTCTASYTQLTTLQAAWLGAANLEIGCTPSSVTATATCRFADIAVSTASVDHGSTNSVIQLNPGSYSANENAGTVTVVVTRTGSTSGSDAAVVNFDNGTALAGTDYTDTTCNITFVDTDASENCVLTITNRSGVTQGDTALTATLTLGSCSNCTLGTSSAPISINDLDASAAGIFFTANMNSIQEFIGEPVDWGFEFGQMCCGTPGSYAILSSDTGNGGPTAGREGSGTFLKLTRTSAQPCSAFASCSAYGDAGNRVGVQTNLAEDNELQLGEYWEGFSMWWPTAFNTNVLPMTGSSWHIVAGIHGMHACEPTSLGLWFMHSNSLQIRSRTTTQDLHPPAGVCNWWDFVTETTHYTTTMPRNQWVDVVIHRRWDSNPAGVGFLEVWINDVQVVDYTGPIGFPHAAGTQAQFNYWMDYADGNHPFTRTFYVDAVKVCDSTCAYEDVSPDPGD